MKLEEIRDLTEEMTGKFDRQALTNNEDWKWAVRCRELMPKLVAVAEAAKEIDEGCYGKSGLGEALAALEAE